MTAPADTGPRNWDEEEGEIEREYSVAKAASDEAFEAIRPGSPTRVVRTEDLITFGEAYRRFQAAGERRTAFLRERYGFKP